MKRIVILSTLILTALILLSSCIDFYHGKRPIDYENTLWISSEADTWFAVHDRRDGCGIGEMIIDGEITEIEVWFDFGASVNFMLPNYTNNLSDFWDYCLFRGQCKFSKDKLIVEIFNNRNGFLDDTIKEITFVREDMEDTT